MNEQFFEGFEFKESQNFQPVVIEREVISPKQISNGGVITTRDLYQELTGDDLDYESAGDFEEDEPWDELSLFIEFGFTLRQLSKKLKQPLSMDGRDIMLVAAEELDPESDEEKMGMLDLYGKLIQSAADCDRKDDGTFLIRLGYLGEEEIVPFEQVLGDLAHEFGHTLGPKFLKSGVFEELKAFAFEHLFMRQYYNLDSYEILADGDGVHTTALQRLEQLHIAGIPSEAIIAHLTSQDFAGFKPDSYLEHCLTLVS